MRGHRKPCLRRPAAALLAALLVALAAPCSPASAQSGTGQGPIPGRAAEMGERLRALLAEFERSVQVPLAQNNATALRRLALDYRDRLREVEQQIEAYLARDPIEVPDREEARSLLARCLVTITQMSVAGLDVPGALAAYEETRAAFPDGRCERFVLAPVADLLRREDPERAPPLYRRLLERVGGIAGPTLDGSGVSLADLRGRVVLVDVWESG